LCADTRTRSIGRVLMVWNHSLYVLIHAENQLFDGAGFGGISALLSLAIASKTIGFVAPYPASDDR